MFAENIPTIPAKIIVDMYSARGNRNTSQQFLTPP
jgi:hypothetical protein